MVVEMQKDEYSARLTITSSRLSSDELTKLFSISPDKKLVKGEPVIAADKPLSGRFVDQDTWILDSRMHVSKYDPLEKHIEFITNILTQVTETPANIFEPGDIEVSLSCFEYSTNPGAHLDSKFITLLSEFRADVDIDFFAVGS